MPRQVAALEPDSWSEACPRAPSDPAWGRARSRRIGPGRSRRTRRRGPTRACRRSWRLVARAAAILHRMTSHWEPRHRPGRGADDQPRVEPAMLRPGQSRRSTTARSIRTASSPFRRIGWWTVVSGGSTCGARSMSSNPTTLTSAGTSRRRSRSAAHRADGHGVAHRQDGRGSTAVIPGAARRPRSRHRCSPDRRRRRSSGDRRRRPPRTPRGSHAAAGR